MKTTFIAVRIGFRADGYLVVGKRMFVARSGRNLSEIPEEALIADAKAEKANPSGHFGFHDEKGDIPPGEYLLGQGTRLTTENYKTMSNLKVVPKAGSNFRKFPIQPTASTRLGNGIKDSRHPGYVRTALLFHYDGDVQGSAGCIVYDDLAVQDALESAWSANHRQVEVIHVKDPGAAKARAEQLVAERNTLD